MTEEANKTTEDKGQSPEAEYHAIAHSALEDHLSAKLLSNYRKPPAAIDNMNCSWLLNCRQPACFL